MTCIFKFSNSKDRRLCRKIDLYRLKDLSTSTDVIGQYCMLTMSEGESSTSNEASDEIFRRHYWLHVN